MMSLTFTIVSMTIPFMVSGFTLRPLMPTTTHTHQISPTSQCVRSPTTTLASTRSPDVVVISPPGGIGEIASIEAARLGGFVRWFVISAPTSSSSGTSINKVSLTAKSLAAIEQSGGSIEFAGATAESVLLGSDDASSAASAVGTWCRGAGSVICTYDGAAEEMRRVDRAKSAEERGSGNEEKLIRSAIRVAAREAASAAVPGSSRVAVLLAGEDMAEGGANVESKGGLLGGLFGGGKVTIPSTISEAMGDDVFIIRHGELFGAPESSPDSSPLIGGPRREPVIRDMYTMRSIRIDPTFSVSGNTLAGGFKTNRLEIGAIVSRLGLGKISIPKEVKGFDVSLSSFSGTAAPSEEEWAKEVNRSSDLLVSPSEGTMLFNAEFGSVPSTKRLAEWVATKWAPAILRSYDIAGIRVGARPVYALQKDDNTVEIVWQELVDFQSVTSGKMVIQIEDNGMTAIRGAGDAARGFGSVSRVPLPGENVLVRRLADAASQAIDKGLADKPTTLKKEPVKVETPEQKLVSVVASPVVVEDTPSTSDSGPRSAGAKRSSERSRGKRKTPPKSSE